LVRVLGEIVEIAVLPMLDAGQDFTNSRPITAELIGDDHTWHVAQPLEQLPKKRFGSGFIPAPLHEDIEDIPILVDGSPEIMPLPLDGQKDFIQMPLISRLGPAAPQLVRGCLPELLAPIAYSLIGQEDAASGHQLLDIAVALAEAEVQPDTMLIISAGNRWRL
jgi:hypothetical protein